MEIQNFKIRVTPEQSRIVQQTLFNNGYKKYYGDEIYIPKEPKTFIYLNKDLNFTANNYDENYFTYNYLPKLTFQEFFDRYVKWCIRGSKELAKWERDKMKSTCDAFLNCTDYYYAPKSDSLVFWNASSKLLENYIELTFEQFEKYVLKSKESKDMEKKIIGYKLLKDLPDRKKGIIFKWDSLEEGGWTSGDEKDDYTYTQEQVTTLTDWFEPVYQETSKELYFGKVKFTIKKGDNFATTEYGKVTKEDIEDAISWVENPPKLAGNTLSIHYNSTYCKITELDNNGTLSYGFGCQEGSLKELKTIYNAFK